MIFDRIENAKSYAALGPAWREALRQMEQYDPAAFCRGKTPFGAGLSMAQLEYETKPASQAALEAHRQYADVMFMAEGEELVYWKPAAALSRISSEYDPETDALLAPLDPDALPLHLTAGMFAVFLPQDAHAPCCILGAPRTVRRVVIKVPLEK